MGYKLKIVFLDFDDVKNPLLGGGQAIATKEVGSRLAKKGYQIVSLCSKYPGYQDRKENGIFYKHVGINTANIKINNLLYLVAAPMALRNIKANLVVECFTAPISTLFTPLFTKIPVVGVPSMFNAKEFAQKYHLPFDWVEKLGFRFYKYLLPYSETDSSKAVKLNPNILYKIVPQGVDSSYLDIKHKKAKHILFLGRFDIWQKGIDLLINSYAKEAKSIGYPLLLAGHGPDEGKIRQLIKLLQLENKITIVGSAYGEKKVRLIEESLFVVFPSRHDEMSLWTLEALASGLPVVAFDLPEGRWMSDKVSLKSKPFDLKDYAKKMVLATDMKLMRKMSKEAREFARQFTWEKVAKEYASFFQLVLRKEAES